MLKIRLSRIGKKSQPCFRFVVQEHTAPIQGRFVEEIGTYMPTTNPKTLKINLERVKHWLSVGAQPSDSVAALLKKEGVDGMDKFIAPRDKQRKKKKAVEEEPAPAAPAPAPAAEAPAPAEEAPAEEAPAEEAPAPAEEEKPAEETPAE